MNKLLILTEKKDYEGIFKGLYSPNGFQVRTLNSEDEIRITDDDHIIIVYPGKDSASLAHVIDSAKKPVTDLRVVCISGKTGSSFHKQFDDSQVDAYFSEQTTLGEIREKVRSLIFPEKAKSG